MSLSTLNNGRVQAPSPYWQFELSPSFQPSPNINYIHVPTTLELRTKIISIFQTLSFLLPYKSVLVQYWAAKETGNSIVLTTTFQPYGISGDNKELESYYKGCLDHKLYVNPKDGVAFGLSGRVYLNRTPEQTQNVHSYPEDQRPPCDDAIFTKIWGSFAVPVIDNGQCFGVLEFVLDARKVSYDDDIGVVCNAFKHAGFQSSFPTNPSTRTYINTRKRTRKTSSYDFTKYSRLVPYFGLSSADAASKIKETSSKRRGEPITPGTFRNACRNVGIPEWPWISNRNARASSSVDTTSSSTPMHITDYGSFGFQANSEFMASNYYGAPIDTPYNYFGDPIASDYMARETSSVGSLTATDDHMSSVSSFTPIREGTTYDQWSYTQSTNTTDASQIPHDGSSFATASYTTEYMESDATSFWTPFTTQNIGLYENSSIQTMTAEASLPETLTNQSAFGFSCVEPLIESQHARDEIMQDSDQMGNVDLQEKFTNMLFDFENWESQNNIPDYR